MESKQIKLDDNGIPILDKPVAAEQVASEQPPSAADLTDPELVERLLREEAVQHLLYDLTEDLQNMMAHKIESFLRDEICNLIKSATQQSAERLSRDIRTHLQLALPELLTKMAEQARR